MYIQQLYTGCLSEAAYYIESNGIAAVIDPMRDYEPFLELARNRKAEIRYIFETHFHADFVSGHLDLSQSTGAPIIYGPKAETRFPVHVAYDGERFKLGEVEVEVLHTPGHTLESTCYLLYNEQGQPHAVFTGDTLFVGDVGRPDLAQQGLELTKESLAGMLYDSLQQKILTLPDEVIVYPAHGAGSSCGKNLGSETFSTLGVQRKTNYALQQSSRQEFIKAVTEGLAAPPHYFPINARINKEGYDSLAGVLENGLVPLSLSTFKALMGQEVLILDTRSAAVFTEGFIPGAIFIGLEGRFAEWAGSILSFEKPIVLIAEPGSEREAVIRLARVGFSQIRGYLQGGFAAWKDSGAPVDMIINVEADELAMDLPFDKHLMVLDVRRDNEFADGHIHGAVNLPVQEMTDPGALAQFEDHQNLYIHCAGGYRSVIAASLLKRQGIHNLRNISGGWNAIREQTGIPIEKESHVMN